MKINGSMMMCVAENRETVMEYVRSDIYFKEGVWDENKVSGHFPRWAGGYCVGV